MECCIEEKDNCDGRFSLYCVTTNRMSHGYRLKRLKCINSTHNSISIVSARLLEVVVRLRMFDTTSF